jgi:hypothetical protein
MRRSRTSGKLAGTAFAALMATVTLGSAQPPAPGGIDRVMILVFDQMRPDYIDRFDLPNFKRVRAASRYYPEAYVGHMGSQTVVSHLVISTGRLPRELPWQDNVMVDRPGRLGKPGAVYDTGRLTREQYWRLLDPLPQNTYLPFRLREKTGRGVFAIGEKDYSTTLLGTPAAAAIVTLTKNGTSCAPSGMNVPAYIVENPRYTVDCSDSYGTGLPTIYALDGAHYVPGPDPGHAGGDVWAADVALEVLAREEWSGLFLTFGGIDKIGHMLGEQDDRGLQSVSTPYRLRDITRIADAQLGRLLDALEQRQLLRRTLLVITSDHGAQRNQYYMGNNKYQSCCGFENNTSPIEPPYWIEHLKQLGALTTTYQDTSIKVWLRGAGQDEASVVSGLADIPGISEVYALRPDGGGWAYKPVVSRLEQHGARFQRWARAHSQDLVNTMAAIDSPHLVALLGDGYGFGRIGDHGGAQERVQRIPLMILVPGERGSVRPEAMRLTDISREIARIMKLSPRAD